MKGGHHVQRVKCVHYCVRVHYHNQNTTPHITHVLLHDLDAIFTLENIL
jgi:hypothetical protein